MVYLSILFHRNLGYVFLSFDWIKTTIIIIIIIIIERKTGRLNGKKYTPKEKGNFNQIYCQTDYKYCLRGIFKNRYPQSRMAFTVTSSNCKVKIVRFYEFLFTLGLR